jgi:shikimate dehydrogenase
MIMIMDQYAVVGNPVSHSLSPKIHALFARQTGQALEYTAIQAPLDGFEETVTTFFSRGGAGLNVTVPFKERAWSLAVKKTAASEKSGAVNTLYLDACGKLAGTNTDGPGLVADIRHNLGYVLAGKRLLLLGAGGAVRGVLPLLLEQQPLSITLANRTQEKAARLALALQDLGAIEVRSFAELTSDFDIVINGTSASLAGDVPNIPESSVRSAELVYDMMYAAKGTPFLQWASHAGATHCTDGLGMLVEQAAEAFFIWRGVRPVTREVLQALRMHNI